MPVTGHQLAQTVLTALERQGGYIWGQSGATWTQNKQKNLEKKYRSNPEAYADYKYSAKYGSRWIGHPVWDCSGLCRSPSGGSLATLRWWSPFARASSGVCVSSGWRR